MKHVVRSSVGPFAALLAASIALLLGAFALASAAGAAETTLTVKNLSDRAVVVSTQIDARASIMKYCVHSRSETHLRGVMPLLVSFMEANECFGTSVKSYHLDGNARLIEAEGASGAYRIVER